MTGTASKLYVDDLPSLIDKVEAFSTLGSASQFVIAFLLIFVAHFVGEFYMYVGDILQVSSLNNYKNSISARVEIAHRSSIADLDYLRSLQASRFFGGVGSIFVLYGIIVVVSSFSEENIELLKIVGGIFFMVFGVVLTAFYSRLCFIYFDTAYLSNQSKP